jgi:hypothetical protein
MLIYINKNKYVFESNIKKGKTMHDLKSTCEMHGVPELMEVAAIIDSLEFKEKPDYNLIKFQLTKILLDMDICPD